MKHKLTSIEREARRDARRAAREAAAEKVTLLKEWREARRTRAFKATREAIEARRSQPRGIDRVPARLHGLAVTTEPYTQGKRGTELAQPADLDPRGNYATRRARGERGKPRRLRRREMPGATARRIERNQKAWSA